MSDLKSYNVKVPIDWWRRGEAEDIVSVRIEPCEQQWSEPSWNVLLDGVHIGIVKKSHYTYSPKAAGFGGRIARYHHQVSCWRVNDSRLNYETRRAALRSLVEDHREKEES